MNNFQRLAENVDVMPLMHAIQRQSDLWNANRLRTSFKGSAMVEVSDILLHFGTSREDMACVFQPAYFRLPQVRGLLSAIRNHVNGYQMERVLISKLEPGARVLPHTDTDGYAGQVGLVRYHLVLQGLPGNLYTCGAEQVDMRTGELWWFDPTQMHSCHNTGKEARVHLMADFRILP